MQKKQNRPLNIKQIIMQTVREKQPETVEKLVKLVQSKFKFAIPEHEIMEHILSLETKGKIVLKEQTFSLPLTYKAYLFSTKATWYWIIIALTLATTTTIFTIPQNAFPVVYARYVLGSIFVLFLPGFCLIKALFPKKELNSIERVGLSIAMSLALVLIISFLLSYTPLGIRTAPVTSSLLALTISSATAAALREYNSIKK